MNPSYIKASNTEQYGYFGHSVSLNADGNTLAVGAYGESNASKGINAGQSDDSLSRAGAVYLFSLGNNGWQQQAYVKASNADAGDNLGYALSVSDDGNSLAVGAKFEGSATRGINGNQVDNSAYQAGAVYLY